MPRPHGSGIITRGYNHITIITRGYGGLFKKIIEAAQRGYYWGRSGYRRAREEVEEIIIYAKLVLVNDKPPPHKIEGMLVTKYKRLVESAGMLVEHVSTKIKHAWNDIVITITRTWRGR